MKNVLQRWLSQQRHARGVDHFQDETVQHKHAVTSMGSNDYYYDNNGNQTKRIINGQTYDLSYDVEGHLLSVKSTPAGSGPINTPYPINTATSVPVNTATKTATKTATATPTAPIPGVDGYTSALLHFDGVDTSTSITDETGRVWTAAGDAQINTSAKKYGSGSLLLDGTGDEITSPDSAAFYWGTGDFTVDFWTRINTLPASGQNAALYAQTEDGTNWARLYLTNSSGTYYWVFRVYEANVMTINVQKATTITAGAWHHIALVRSGNDFKLFEDGTQLGTTTTDTDPIPDLTGAVHIGTSDGTNWPFNGRVDEFTISKGTARWSANFNPGPTPTPTITTTPTKTATSTQTPTPAESSTVTATATATATQTATQTPAATNTATASPTATRTATAQPASALNASFTYDGNGQMVKAVINNRTTLYVSGGYQIADPNTPYESITKIYAGGAMRVDGVLYYTFGDHLGSTSLTTNAAGVKVAEVRYKAWGEVRYQSGDTHTDKGYTGQRSYASDFGLQYYNARWYDTGTGRFAQADTIVPGGAQGLDRYAYVNNSPINFTDPSGHCGVKEGKFDGKYDCTADDINSATMKNRLGWFKGFIAEIGHEDWFQNIVGILEAFIDEGIGETGSWVSWTDTGILDSIENGWNLFKNPEEKGSSADMAWKDFFGESNQNAKKSKWGIAEDLGTKAGMQLAHDQNTSMNLQERLFLIIGDTYRGWLKNQTGDDFFKQFGTDIAKNTLPKSSKWDVLCAGSCYNVLVDQAGSAGSSFGTWFTDPRSTIPGTGKGPVYFFARIVLGN